MCRKKFTNFLNKAYKAHKHSDECRYRHVAVIVKGGSILSVGFNSMKPHPMAMLPLGVLNKAEIVPNDTRTIHAEMDAIRKIKDKRLLSSCELWVYSEMKNGTLRISKPCSLCQHYIQMYGIKTVHFSTESGWEKL